MRGVALCSWLLGANIGITYTKFLPNSQYALIGGFGNTLGIYDNKTGKKKKMYEGIANTSYPLAHSYGKIGKDFYVFGSSEIDEIKIWNMKSEEIEYEIELPKGDDENEETFAACVDYNESSQRLAVCGPNAKNAAYLYTIPSK